MLASFWSGRTSECDGAQRFDRTLHVPKLKEGRALQSMVIRLMMMRSWGLVVENIQYDDRSVRHPRITRRPQMFKIFEVQDHRALHAEYLKGCQDCVA